MKRVLIALMAATFCAALAIPTIAFAAARPAAGLVAHPAITMADASASFSGLQGCVKAMSGMPDACARVVECVSPHHFLDADGDGVCDNAGVGTCLHPGCSGYVDADGDGVCDNYPNGNGNDNGNGYGYGSSNGNGSVDDAGSADGVRWRGHHAERGHQSQGAHHGWAY